MRKERNRQRRKKSTEMGKGKEIKGGEKKQK